MATLTLWLAFPFGTSVAVCRHGTASERGSGEMVRKNMMVLNLQLAMRYFDEWRYVGISEGLESIQFLSWSLAPHLCALLHCPFTAPSRSYY